MSKSKPMHPMLQAIKDYQSNPTDDDDYDFIDDDESEEFQEYLQYIRNTTPQTNNTVQEQIELGQSFVDSFLNRFSEDDDTPPSYDPEAEEFIRTYSHIFEYECSMQSEAVATTMFNKEIAAIKQGIQDDHIDIDFNCSPTGHFVEHNDTIHSVLNKYKPAQLTQPKTMKEISAKVIQAVADKHKIKRLNFEASKETAKSFPQDFKRYLNFDDKGKSVSSDLIHRMRFIFTNHPKAIKKLIPSRSEIFDFGDIINKHLQEFKRYSKHCKSIHRSDLVFNWYKFHFWKSIPELVDKIVILTNPNQIPNQFRNKFNEIIVIPATLELNEPKVLTRLMELSTCFNYVRKFIKSSQSSRLNTLLDKLVYYRKEKPPLDPLTATPMEKKKRGRPKKDQDKEQSKRIATSRPSTYRPSSPTYIGVQDTGT